MEILHELIEQLADCKVMYYVDPIFDTAPSITEAVYLFAILRRFDSEPLRRDLARLLDFDSYRVMLGLDALRLRCSLLMGNDNVKPLFVYLWDEEILSFSSKSPENSIKFALLSAYGNLPVEINYRKPTSDDLVNAAEDGLLSHIQVMRESLILSDNIDSDELRTTFDYCLTSALRNALLLYEPPPPKMSAIVQVAFQYMPWLREGFSYVFDPQFREKVDDPGIWYQGCIKLVQEIAARATN